jgi:4-hydroxy-tetrahydrodipicolinate synthase
MSAKTVAKIIREIDRVDYVKEETAPAGPVISETIQLLKDESKFKGVMGGQGCAYLLTEYRRGACGNMPACHVTDALVHLWNVIETGSEDEARAMFDRFLPLFSVERQYPGTTYKVALHKRGVIDSIYDRAPRRPGLDSYELDELDKAMRGIEDLLTCTKCPWRG